MGQEPILPAWREAFQRLEGAYAPATMKSYYTDVEIFVTWCGDAGVCALPFRTNSAASSVLLWCIR